MSPTATRVTARPISRIVVLVTVLSLLATPAAAAPRAPLPDADPTDGASAPIERGLLDELRTGAVDRFVVEFAAEADLGRAARISDFVQRGRFVLNALRRASAVQDEAIELARARGARAQSFWLRNSLVVDGGAALASALAKLPGVSAVRAEKVYPLVVPVDARRAVLAELSEPEWGVAKIGADQVWEDGILGSGIVVANVDTGVQYDHPALVGQYRGNLGGGSFDHDYSWWDPTGICGDEPCDNAGHGTHTMGTIAGGDGPGPFTPDIGVAPGASWIAAKGCEDLFCSESALLSAGQFILAPTDLDGNNPDPSKRPDIVNNSWGGGPGDEFYRDVVTAWRAAGIIPVFSAGNSGPGCDTGGSPGDFLESFSVGATDVNDVIAGFSSRGPSVYGKVNPDVSAPGVAVLSSVPGDGYAEFDGTSMAAPHTAGTLALMLSAEIALVGDFVGATSAVRDTALDILDDQCGGDEDGDPNNVYGDGRIDAAAAVALVATGGTLAGTVTDVDTGDPIGGATVTASAGGREFTATTAGDGTYSLFLAAGTYAVNAQAFGYAPSAIEGVVIETDTTTTQDLELDALPRFDVTGVVTAAADGEPIEAARVKAVGTPVAAAVTAADGSYTLTLPIGSYTLRASAGGCTALGFAEVELVDADVEADFSIARKLDDFGHGCGPIAFDWVDADTETSLFGDEFVGRLRLPFDFPFYGEEYDQVYLSDNGYLNFLGPDQFNSFPVEIPTPSQPNAAIYALWQDLFVDDGGAIAYDTVGTAPNRAFVIEYDAVKAGSRSVTFEIKLWENGNIDLLYADAGTGENAGIGIEDADGTDGLQFSFLGDVLDDEVAYRFTEVPTGLVTGTVTDANDGAPVEGAVVEALGSGRSAETQADGTYELRLHPGSYDLEIRSDGYETHAESISLAADEVLVVDAALLAPIASVDPTELDATVALGESTERTVTLSNSGSAPLAWEVRERPTGFDAPDLPEITGAPMRIPTWEKPNVPRNLPQARTTAIPSDQLDEIIVDPDGDGGAVDIVGVRAGADPAEITMELVYASESEAAQGVGYVFLDIDQDPATGIPAEFLAGLPTQDVGMEFFVDLFLVHEPEPVVLIVDANTFEITAVTEARVEGDTIGFDVPMEAIGGDDGFVNTALVTGDFNQPTDWAPDEGHGTIEPFSDAPWVSESPESGTVPAGESVDVTVTLGGEDVDAGTYEGRLVFVTSDPRTGSHSVAVSLDVELPAEFGGAGGTVWDAHTGEPVAGATVLIEAEVGGEPYPVEVTSRGDGSWEAFGPEGTWPMTVTADDYLGVDGEAVIAAGSMTPGQDAFLHRAQPHAVIDGGPYTFVLRPGRSASRSLLIGNFEGHAELEFGTGEVSYDSASAVAPAAGPRSLPDGWDASARTTEGLPSSRVDGRSVQFPGDVLTAWPTEGLDLPWGVAFNGSVWLGDAIESNDACGFVDGCTFHEFSPDGVPSGTVLGADWVDVFPADMAWDAERGWLWTVHVGGDNGLYAIDPGDGTVMEVLTGAPWSNTSQRGVAYDAVSDTFFVGGWNEGVIYHVAGLSWETPGETLSSCSPADPNIAGLAWNPAFNLLWMATNSDFDDIWLVDPASCEILSWVPHPEPGFNGAGLELDDRGNLWTVAQGSATAYLIESGLPVFSDAPWLSVSPEEGTVAPGDAESVTVSVDSSGLAAGVYRADLVVLTNDPEASAVSVPVTLVVPSYQVGVNAGGSAYTAGDGVRYRRDRAYTDGGFGYIGRGAEVRGTSRAIRGTSDDPLYQRMRVGMRQYRFDVPERGTYSVKLRFAEIEHDSARDRVFTIFIEGEPVLVNLDVHRRAGARRAYNATFTVPVSGPALNIRFSGQLGDVPMISAILVTHRPDLGGFE